MEIGITLNNRLVKNYEFKPNKSRIATMTLLLLFTVATVTITIGGAGVMAMTNTPTIIPSGLGITEKVVELNLGTVVQQSMIESAIAKISPILALTSGGISALAIN